MAADAAWCAPLGDGYAAFILFRNREDLLNAISKVRENGYTFDLLSNYLLLKTAQLLTLTYRGLQTGRLLFVSGLPRETGNRQLREIFQTIGPVEAAMVAINLEAGVPIGNGVVLFASQEYALAAKQNPPLAGEFGAPLMVTDFRGKLERAAGAPEPQPVPQVATVIPRARDHLKTLIRNKERQGQRLETEQITRLVNAVSGLCLDDVYTLVQFPPRLDAWVEKQLK